MRVAVISDVHGYSIALRAVLADIDRHPEFDTVVAAGDLCESGPDPAGSLDLLIANDVKMVVGNTDEDLARGARDSSTIAWTAEELGPVRLQLLAGLPHYVRVGAIPESPDTDVLIVHANPHDLRRGFQPGMSDNECRDLIGSTRAGVIAFGHVHVAFEREIDGMLLVDVSAVGNPKDEDLRPRWSEFVWDPTSARWTHERHYVPYPLEETRRQIEASTMPKPERAYRRLVHASYRPLD